MKHYIYGGETYTYELNGKEYKFEILQDEDAMSPREWDSNCGTIAAKYGDYILCDEGHNDPEEEADKILRKHGFDDDELYDMSYNDKMLKIAEYDDIALLHLFVYDHGGISISTGGYVDRWDSSRVGFIYVTKEKFFKDFSQDEANWRTLAREYLRNEISTFNKYLQGEVYWFILSEKVVKQERCPHCNMVIKEYEVWEEIDSCGGYFCDTLEDLLDEAGIEINLESWKKVE